MSKDTVSKDIMNILLVEDSKTSVLLVQGLLVMEGDSHNVDFPITVAMSLADARKHIAKKKFDLVLLDLTLPDSTGIATVDAIVSAVPDIPVIVLTSSDAETLGIEALKRGVQDFLVKDETYRKVLVRSVRYAYQRKKAEQEIREAREMAEFTTRSKSDFITNLSHELRTPLNAIIGFSQMMITGVHGKLNDKYAEYARDINNSGNYLNGLIGTVLDMSKIEARQTDFIDEKIDLKSTIDLAIVKTTFQAKANNVAVSFINGDDMTKIRGDATKLMQILLNLLGNAIKFSHSDGEVTISVYHDDDESLVMAIKDNGIGIPADQIDDILLPFARSSLSKKMNVEGTGLGLPLCKSLIEAHQGVMWIESEVGKGTSVFVSLPPERIVSKA